jgi:sirohydrochlorin cobaltochelatase
LQIIEWTNDFALGIDEIDQQHRALVGMINALDASTHGDPRPETTSRMLEQLADYVRDHFALEERLMAGGGCTPELVARHCGEHAYFRSVLADLTKDFASGRSGITVSLIEYLVHWLLHHIVVVDRAMAQQLTATEPALAERIAVAMMQNVTDGLTDSERHLLSELRRANEELERQVVQRTQALSEANARLEADLGRMSALVEQLRSEQALPGLPEAPARQAPQGLRSGLILLAHGARASEWAGPLNRVCEAVRLRAPDLRVEPAFLEFMTPALQPCAEMLLAEGVQRIIVLPMFMAQGGHLKRDVPQLLDALRAQHPQARLELAVAVGEADDIVQAMAAHALALAGPC